MLESLPRAQAISVGREQELPSATWLISSVYQTLICPSVCLSKQVTRLTVDVCRWPHKLRPN
jgi:hypothetical protein